MAVEPDLTAPSPSRGGPQVERVPPHNLDAEVSVVGSMLLSKDAIAEATEHVRADDFYRGAHRTMFEAALSLYDRGEPVDPVSLAEELKSLGRLDDVGGQVEIAEIVHRVPTPANAAYYARIVAAAAMKRRLIDTGTRITQLGYDDTQDAQPAVDSAESLIYQLSANGRVGEVASLKELLTSGFEMIEQLHDNQSALTGLATGFTDFDNLTAGLQSGNLIILAARPAMGKSTMVVNVATHVSVKLRRPVAIFSLEMSQMELVQRILAGQARVDSDRLRTGRLREEDWPKLSEAFGKLADAPMFIDDTPDVTMMEIRSKCRRLKQQHGLELVIVDYLQLMQSPQQVESRVQEVAQFSRGMKVLAKELDVPVIALSQLSRKPEDRVDHRPQLADLRESGCVTAATRVWRADTGERVPIGRLAADDARDVWVWSLGRDYRLVPARLVRAFPTGTKRVFCVRLASGRQVHASANHPFLTFAGWTRLDELQAGERIAVPRAVPEPQGGQAWPEPALVRVAGLLAGGWTPADDARVGATPLDAAAAGGQAGGEHSAAAWLDHASRRELLTPQRRIPEVVFRLKDSQLALFVASLWAAGGLLRATAQGLEAAYPTDSEALARGLQAALTRLGVASRLTHGRAPTPWRLEVVGVAAQRALLARLDLAGDGGEPAQQLRAHLDALSGDTAEGDTWPLEVWDEIRTRMSDQNVTPAALSAAVGHGGCATRLWVRPPSREVVARAAETLDCDHLATLAASDLAWDVVASIDDVGEQPVYDATVADTHNFLADGVVVENSLEQDADIVSFIYRDEAYDPDSPAKGEAELIVAKHRNGPIGTIPLAFLGSTSRFANLRRDTGRSSEPSGGGGGGGAPL
jgi:replicative DNA helicase